MELSSLKICGRLCCRCTRSNADKVHILVGLFSFETVTEIQVMFLKLSFYQQQQMFGQTELGGYISLNWGSKYLMVHQLMIFLVKICNEKWTAGFFGIYISIETFSSLKIDDGLIESLLPWCSYPLCPNRFCTFLEVSKTSVIIFHRAWVSKHFSWRAISNICQGIKGWKNK